MEGLAFQGGKGARVGSGLRTDEPIEGGGVLGPVNQPIFRSALGHDATHFFILMSQRQRTGSKLRQRLLQQLQPTFFDTCVKRCNGVRREDRLFSLSNDGTGVDATIHLKQGDTGLGFAIDHRPDQRRTTAIIR